MSSMSMSLPITLPRHCSNLNVLIDSVNEMFALQRCHEGQGLRESAGKSCGIWNLWLKEVKNTWMLGWVLICFIFVFHSFHNSAFPKIKEGVWSITLHQDVISEGANPADASRGLNFQRSCEIWISMSSPNKSIWGVKVEVLDCRKVWKLIISSLVHWPMHLCLWGLLVQDWGGGQNKLLGSRVERDACG